MKTKLKCILFKWNVHFFCIYRESLPYNRQEERYGEDDGTHTSQPQGGLDLVSRHVTLEVNTTWQYLHVLVLYYKRRGSYVHVLLEERWLPWLHTPIRCMALPPAALPWLPLAPSGGFPCPVPLFPSILLNFS